MKKEIKDYALDMVSKHPNLKQDIIDLYHLCLDEIENEESPQNEFDLFIGSVEDLIREEEL